MPPLAMEAFLWPMVDSGFPAPIVWLAQARGRPARLPRRAVGNARGRMAGLCTIIASPSGEGDFELISRRHLRSSRSFTLASPELSHVTFTED